MGQNLSNLVRIPNMGIWFLAQTSSIFCPIWMRFETTSYKWSTHNLDLCMLSGFGIIGCTTGTIPAGVGVRDPLVTGPSLSVNC